MALSEWPCQTKIVGTLCTDNKNKPVLCCSRWTCGRYRTSSPRSPGAWRSCTRRGRATHSSSSSSGRTSTPTSRTRATPSTASPRREYLTQTECSMRFSNTHTHKNVRFWNWKFQLIWNNTRKICKFLVFPSTVLKCLHGEEIKFLPVHQLELLTMKKYMRIL